MMTAMMPVIPMPSRSVIRPGSAIPSGPVIPARTGDPARIGVPVQAKSNVFYGGLTRGCQLGTEHAHNDCSRYPRHEACAQASGNRKAGGSDIYVRRHAAVPGHTSSERWLRDYTPLLRPSCQKQFGCPRSYKCTVRVACHAYPDSQNNPAG